MPPSPVLLLFLTPTSHSNYHYREHYHYRYHHLLPPPLLNPLATPYHYR